MTPDPWNKLLNSALAERARTGNLRQLGGVRKSGIDFSSNDYLGFARDSRIVGIGFPGNGNGSGGARLVSGDSPEYHVLEERLAGFHGAPAALIFNSGYDANVGLLSALALRHTTIIYDSLIHASVRDGVRMGFARSFAFRHNDLDDLEARLQRASGPALVCVESLYSMEGDFAPLGELVALCERYGAGLVVDEAHATGIFGSRGAGLVEHEGLGERVFARLHTFGKALGCHGACVLGSRQLREYLINFARSFIYTTALPPHALAAISGAYDRLETGCRFEVERLFSLVDRFRSHRLAAHFGRIDARSPIQALMVQGNDRARELSRYLVELGFDARAILSPTVPAGRERIRICLHAFNTSEECDALFAALAGFSGHHSGTSFRE